MRNRITNKDTPARYILDNHGGVHRNMQYDGAGKGVLSHTTGKGQSSYSKVEDAKVDDWCNGCMVDTTRVHLHVVLDRVASIQNRLHKTVSLIWFLCMHLGRGRGSPLKHIDFYARGATKFEPESMWSVLDSAGHERPNAASTVGS
jgi:hypothetical protein